MQEFLECPVHEHTQVYYNIKTAADKDPGQLVYARSRSAWLVILLPNNRAVQEFFIVCV